MPKDAAARLVEQEVPQGLIAGDEARLLPDRLARWRRRAADDDVADLALRVTRDGDVLEALPPEVGHLVAS